MDATDDRVEIVEAGDFLAGARAGDAEAFCRLTEPLQSRLLRQAAALSGDLTHGQYPESLDALIPQFLDKISYDVIGGQPPHYRRTAAGAFTLYSIGWSGRDGGGVTGKSKEVGDWVWPETRL